MVPYPDRTASLLDKASPHRRKQRAQARRKCFWGAYFVTRDCIEAAIKIRALKVPWHWHSKMQEDVYFSMVTVAAGFQLGHFAAPEGPLCMEWRGLLHPAAILAASKYKLVHSVDKGPNTGPTENGGKTAREVYRDLRMTAVTAQGIAEVFSK